MMRREFVFGLGALCVASPVIASSVGITTVQKMWDNGNHAFITKARPGSYRAEIVSAHDVLGKSFAMPREILEKTGASVCFNGGFFENDGSPSGLYVKNGKIRKSLTSRAGDGILYTNKNGQLQLVRRDEFHEHIAEIVDALQCNLLSYNNTLLYTENVSASLQPRHLIGFSSDGLTEVIFKETNFTLGDRYMRAEHHYTSVAALDGGPSASAYTRSGESSARSEDRLKEVPVANFLTLYNI